MTYSTAAMVRMALVPSSNGAIPNPASNTAADLTDAQLLDAIAEADATIDGYIGAYYAVPVAQNSQGAIPHPIDFWSRNLAAYSATLTYRRSLDFTDTDPIARRYKDTMAALNAVSTGKMKLQLPVNESDNSAVAAGDVFNPYDGDLWTPDDFSLGSAQSPNLTQGVNGWEPFWRGPLV